MGQQEVYDSSNPEQLRQFMKAVLTDLRALEHMINAGMFDAGVRRIGAEQELILISQNGRPAPIALQLLNDLNDPLFTTELASFNMEFNLPPLEYRDDCLSKLEATLTKMLERARAAARHRGADCVLAGILPTLVASDLTHANMTPRPRYYALNQAMRNLRGAEFELRITGIDELNIKSESLMLEACNTSCQVHFQVEPHEFARYYNIAQAVAGPTLAAAANSPLLFGRRLWRETRIAVFQQVVDTRLSGTELQERSARVSFGRDWVHESVLEIYRDDIARFRVILATEIDEDPFERLAKGEAPRLKALQLYNSTVYRWNRPCYGVLNGKPGLRIENRVLPAGPSVADEVANAAFWFGLVSGIASEIDDIRRQMSFAIAKENFVSAARHGLDAHLTWTDGVRMPAQELIAMRLLPLARNGLTQSGVREQDINHYLGIIEDRVASAKTGASWQLRSLQAMDQTGARGERMSALVAAMVSRQQAGNPCHLWEPATLVEGGGWKRNYLRVDQYMTTDVFTVHEDEVLDLVANVMDWRKIRHIPVEDREHRLVGLVSYRALLRYLAHAMPHGPDHSVPVKTVMKRDPITISPETSTREAIEIMRRNKIACLPVVSGGRLVGIVTERDFMEIAAQLLETQLESPE
ncbi:MAG: CBS domain-containing protein [Phycisphaerales bacterium]|nr:CBS domain-containing protein [Phycisphaerales bacterium]